MAASVDIMRWYGSLPGSKYAITGLNTRANTFDFTSSGAAVNDVQYPVQIPISGANYSYWVSTRLYANTPPATQISNLFWYLSSSNNLTTGITCHVCEASGYMAAATGGTAGSTGLQLTAIYPVGGANTIVGSVTELSVFVQPHPLATYSAKPGAGTDFGNFMVYQMYVDNSAQPGNSGQLTFTWKYDES